MRVFILLSILLQFGLESLSQDCSILGPIDILSFESTDIVLTVSNLVNEDLAVDQEICGIRLVFNHNQLENLRISLTSPAGDQVTLMGPGTVAGGLTSLILWDINFNPCGNPAAPDPGFMSQWDNNQVWTSFETYTGIYHPSLGCLEDFNTGSANGDWILSIENLGNSSGSLQYFELIFCNDTGTECSDCFLYAGDFSNSFETFCESDSRLNDISIYLDNEIIIDADQSFSYILYEGDSIMGFDQNFTNLDSLLPNIYTICAVAFAIKDSILLYGFESIDSMIASLENREFCGDLSDNCFVFEVLESINNILIDTLLCRGDTLHIRDLKITDMIDTVITVFDTTNVQPFVIECDTVYNILVQMIDIEAIINAPSQTIICGNPIFLNGSSSNSSFGPIVDYQWSTIGGAISNSIGPITESLSAGSYILNIDDSRCLASDTIIIDQQDDFNVELEQNEVFCFNDTLYAEIMYEFIPDSVFLFGPNSLSVEESQFSTLESGQYILESYYADCVSSDTIVLINDAAPLNILVSYDTIDCFTLSASVEIMTNGMNPTIMYDGPESISDNDFSPEIITAGLYFLTVTDEVGCSATSLFEIINDSDMPEINLVPINISCSEGEVALPLSSNMIIDSVSWIGPDNFESNEINPLSEIPGSYIAEIFAPNGCSAIDSLILTVTNETILFNVTGGNIDCIDNEVELCVQSGQLLDSIAWVFQSQIVSNNDCIISSQAGQYLIEVFDENGCFGIQNYTVLNLVEPIEAIINAETQTIYCDLPINLDGSNSIFSNNSDIIWLDANGQQLSEDLSIDVDFPGIYYLEIYDTTSQCFHFDSIIVNAVENSFSEIEFEILQPTCFGDNGIITIDGYSTIVDFDIFLNGNLLTIQDSIYSLPFGEYQFELIDENTCFFDTLLNILQGTNINLDLGDDQTVGLSTILSLDIQVDIDIENIVSYNWSHPELLSCNTCLNPDILINENITLSLELMDIFGCTDSDEVNYFTDNMIDFYVPNIFTPNGDGNNDILTINISDPIQKIFDFQIIDRWGNLLIFHSEIANKGFNNIWDGSSQGKFVEDGVYVYVATLLLIDNSEVLIFGDITLLK